MGRKVLKIGLFTYNQSEECQDETGEKVPTVNCVIALVQLGERYRRIEIEIPSESDLVFILVSY